MSKLEGGIFSRPRGKTGGIVFGAARTRRGKQTTTRLLVPPSNPNTQAQQAQRSRFKLSLDLVKAWGPDVYQEPFNRVVSQLPGFQSLLSIVINAATTFMPFSAQGSATYLRGSNPLPAGLSYAESNDELTVTWDTTPAPGGLDTDEVFIAFTAGDNWDDALQLAVFKSGQTIADGATGYTFDLPEGEVSNAKFIWTVGSGANSGVYSNIIRNSEFN